jgi:hypothetical protein
VIAVIASVTFTTVVAALILVVVRQRRTIKRLLGERAEAAASAIVGCVRVAGHDLPLPTDERWKHGTVTLVGDTLEAALLCGPVVVTNTHAYVRPPVVTASTASLPATGDLSRYIAAVWLAQRNRVVREATP